jgi:uncharacterized membrane protein (DUF373 family)
MRRIGTAILPTNSMKEMTQQGMDYPPELVVVTDGHPRLRKYLEFVQDIIVLGLCAILFIAMLTKLFHLGQTLLSGTDFSVVIADVLFILVLIELFRLLIIYLEEHRISVSTMVEVGIVSTLREVILKGPLEIDWRQLLVLCAFILSLGLLLRYAGVRFDESGDDSLADKRALKGAA